MSSIKPSAVVLAVVVLLGCAAEVALATSAPIIELGPSDGLALDQPRVVIEVIDDTGAAPHSLGPEFQNECLLDTGANSVLLAGATAEELVQNGLSSQGEYLEQGVAGFTLLQVSAPMRFDYAGGSGERHTLSGAHLLYASDLELGVGGVVGMPAMIGNVVTMDMTPWSGGEVSYMLTEIGPELPAGEGHRYSVPLALVDFPQSGQVEPDDPLPVWAPVPFLNASVSHGGVERSGRFLLDTGAQLSILSAHLAFDLGLDKNGDGDFDEEKVDEIEVGGIGGTITMPLLAVDALLLDTSEGPRLRWTQLVVGVLDIHEEIDGVFGMEMLTSGWFEVMLGSGGGEGYFRRVHLDFRAAAEHAGTLVLDLNPAIGARRPPAAARHPGWGARAAGAFVLLLSSWVAGG